MGKLPRAIAGFVADFAAMADVVATSPRAGLTFLGLLSIFVVAMLIHPLVAMLFVCAVGITMGEK